MKCPECGRKVEGLNWWKSGSLIIECKCKTKMLFNETLFGWRLISWHEPKEEKEKGK